MNKDENHDLIYPEKRVKITEENVEAYRVFITFTNLESYLVPLASKREVICYYKYVITGVLLSLGTTFTIVIRFQNSIIAIIIALLSLVSGVYATCKITEKTIKKMNMETFQKQYPDFDITIDPKQARIELEKYIELSKLPKTIEEDKLEHQANMPNNFQELSTTDKIAFLNQEREFWKQVAIQEKYEDKEDTKGIQYQKK